MHSIVICGDLSNSFMAKFISMNCSPLQQGRQRMVVPGLSAVYHHIDAWLGL